MASLRNRIIAVWNALVSGSPGMSDYAGAMVRPHEEGNRLRRYTQSTAADLCRRFAGHVKTCQSMNANGVACVKFGVYRRKGSGKKSYWETKPVARKELLRQRRVTGDITKSAASMSDDVEEVTDPLHPLVALLRDVNPMMNGVVLKEQIQYWTGLTGDCYLHKVAGPEGYPVELWPIPTPFIRPLPSRNVVISEYIYGRGTEVERSVSASEIMRFTQFNASGDPYRGSGDLEACIDEADLGRAISQFRLATIDNGAEPGLIVIAKDMAGEVPRQQLEDQLNRKYAGLSKAGRSVVITGDVEIVQRNMGEKEVAFLASEDQVRELIANCHDIPIILLTMRDSGALAAARAAREGWQERGLRPRCNRIADTFNQQLVPDFGDDRLYICPEEVVQKDMEAAATRIRTLYTGDDKSIITLNEARAELDYDALPDGDTIPEPAPPPTAAPGQSGASGSASGNKPNAADSAKKELGHEPQRRPLVPAIDEQAWSQSTMLVKGPACQCCSHHPAIVRKDASMDRMDDAEKIAEASLRNWFRGIEPSLVAAMRDDGSFTPPPQLPESLRGVLTPVVEAAGKTGYNFGVQELGKDAGGAQLQTALSKPVSDFLRHHTGEAIKSVTETIEKAVREQLAQGVDAGESVPQLTARVQGVAQDLTTYGAERIARTEVARAFLAAREQAWKSSGNVWGKRWARSNDSCPFCREVAKQFNSGIPLGTNFFEKGDTLTLGDGQTMKLDYAAVSGPPLHPNDRCSLVFVKEEPKP